MQVQRLAHGTEAHRSQRATAAQACSERPRMASQPRRSELLRATHAQHPARIATAAPAISSTAVSSRAAPASPTLESASDFAWRARPESLDDITSFGRSAERSTTTQARRAAGRLGLECDRTHQSPASRQAAASGAILRPLRATTSRDDLLGRRPWGPSRYPM